MSILRPVKATLLILFFLSCQLPVQAEEVAEAAPSATSYTFDAKVIAELLPPQVHWDGSSKVHLANSDNPWITPAEQSQLQDSPDYETTMAWIKRLANATDLIQLELIGRSAQGRDIVMAIVDKEGLQSPEAIQKSGRGIVLVHAGIHSGEIDGKDAGMMLLRELTVGGSASELLDQVSLLFIPILNVDGHERSSAFNRINQRGPSRMGWRTNARNLNLNRDYAKLETAGVRSLVSTINLWQPDLYIDIHVTDGVDYQYDVTYGWNGPHAWSPNIADWLDSQLRPEANRALSAAGHIPGPLIFSANGRDMNDGMLSWTASPRFSTGWADARHLAHVLLENHSLKPYPQRVLGTYVFLHQALKTTGDTLEELRQATIKDRFSNQHQVTLGWKKGADRGPINFKGIQSSNYLSAISGGLATRWTGEPIEQEIPLYVMDEPTVTVNKPQYYYIPIEWSEIADRLRRQGVLVDVLTEPATVSVEVYRLKEATLDSDNTPFEGRARFLAGTPEIETVMKTFQAGDFRVDTNQSLGTLATLLLEPQSPDSYFQWGYMAEVLQVTEYFENYALEPLAREMLEQDLALRTKYETKLLQESEFAASPRKRLHWFYEQSPYYDEAYLRYPIYRSTQR